MAELWQHSAGELADLIRRREVSSREVVDAHLARIEAVNPRVNAIVEVLTDRAREEAALADRAVAAGGDLGPLHGVPVTVKQNVDVAGTATTLGLRALAGAIAPVDGPPVGRLREAGAIVIGRTNLPDVALRWHTESNIAGTTVNPWSAAISCGGSSGGEAVALATGMSPLGVGTDVAGSVRVPAAACGIASVKVTWGRVADTSVVAPALGAGIAQMDTTGPMARRVADLRIALDRMRRPGDRDSRYRDVPLPTDTAPTRFAVVIAPGTHPDVADAIEGAAKVLEAEGWTVSDRAAPDFAPAVDAWLGLIGHDVVEGYPQLAEVCGESALQFLDLMRAVIPVRDEADFAATFERRTELGAEWAAYQADTPIVLTTVMQQPTFAPGADLTDPLAVVASVGCVPGVNLLGLPAAVFPVGMTGGTPIGAQLIGPAWREDLCLAAAATLERALGPVLPIDPR